MISEELKRIKEAKDALKVSINNKGVTVTDADSISVYASKVDLIVTGSTIEMQSIDITENGKYENTSIPYSSVTVNVDDGGARIKELEDEIVDLNSQITEKQNKIDELQNKLDYDEGLINDLRTEITTLETQKLALENELNELKAKVNSMTDLNATSNGTYTPSFGYKKVTVNVPSDRKEEQSVTITNNGEYTYTETVVTGITVNVDTEKHTVTSKTISENGEYNSSGNEVWNKVTVNVPQTGSDITLTEITITDVGEYTAPEKIAYNKILVPSETFYKKYTDDEGNTYIINEDGEIVVTYTGSTPPTPTDEYFYITIYIPSDKAYSSVSTSFLYTSAFTELYFDGEEYEYYSSFKAYTIRNKPIEPNSYHTIKARLVNDNDTSSIKELMFYTLNLNTSSSGYAEVHKVQYANGTTKIEYFASFVQSSYIKEIIIPNTVINIDSDAFYNFSSLTSINIPDSVTSIGDRAFSTCSSLTSITIGSGVTSIGRSAFGACSSLTNITYNGTKAQFTSITKGSSWRYNVPTTCVVHCTDGDYPITDFN